MGIGIRVGVGVGVGVGLGFGDSVAIRMSVGIGIGNGNVSLICLWCVYALFPCGGRLSLVLCLRAHVCYWVLDRSLLYEYYHARWLLSSSCNC